MFYSLIIGNLLMLTTGILKFSHLPPQIPLFYSKSWGEEQLADTWMLIILPLILNILYFVNLFILRKFFAGNEFVSKIILYLNLFISVSITLIFIKIIFLVT